MSKKKNKSLLISINHFHRITKFFLFNEFNRSLRQVPLFLARISIFKEVSACLITSKKNFFPTKHPKSDLYKILSCFLYRRVINVVFCYVYLSTFDTGLVDKFCRTKNIS